MSLARHDPCCDGKQRDLAHLVTNQRSVLKTVLAINALMFAVELTAGMIADSTSLIGDSLDMLGDAAVYALTLYVLDRDAVFRLRVVAAKGLVMAALGLGVLAHAAFQVFAGVPPRAEWMGSIGALALAANLACAALLYRHRADDANMRSTWLCSRNDVLANCGVVLAAFAVHWLDSIWPDVIVGVLIAALFVRSAITVLEDAVSGLRAERQT